MDLFHLKECRVVLDRIDVSKYRNVQEHVRGNVALNRNQDVLNENSIATVSKNFYECEQSDVESEVETSAAILLIASCYFLREKLSGNKTNDRKKNKRRRRSIWVREWIEKRQKEGAYGKLLQELRSGDNGEQRLYREFLRMSHQNFEHLLQLVAPLIEKRNTKLRESIPAGERLALTLHFLATGQSFHSLQYLFRIPQCTISMIIPEVLDAIWTVLKDEFIRVCLYRYNNSF